MRQCEGNGFSTCLEGFCALVRTKPSKQVEKPFPSHWHILLACSWLSWYFLYHGLAKTISCSWIGWLIPREAALGALCCEQFQLMPNPLAGVKKEDMFMVVSALFSYSTMYNVNIVETRKEFNTTVCTLI